MVIEKSGKERLVLLYDELDAYADPPVFGRRLFDSLEDIRKRSGGRLAIFAAGGPRLIAIDSIYGSSLFTRATPHILEPFTYEQLVELAAPFAERDTPLPEEVMQTLLLSSGGHVALATFGLQTLWTVVDPSPLVVVSIFQTFVDDHLTMIEKILEPTRDGPAGRVLRALRDGDGSLEVQALRDLEKPRGEEGRVRTGRIFQTMRASGMIRADKATHRQNPIQVEFIPSILTLDLGDAEIKDSLREQLLADLSDALAQIHRMSMSYFQGKKSARTLLPEAVFAASIVIALHSRGWRAEAESVSAAGRTDIKATLQRFGDRDVVIEVKLWGRNDYKEIQAQVERYWSHSVEVLATVMIADHKGAPKIANWPQDYAKACLVDHKIPYEDPTPPSPVLAAYFVADTMSDLPVAHVDHLLLSLAHR